MVKYRFIKTFHNFEGIKNVLDHYNLKWEAFEDYNVTYFVFRCGDKRYKDILALKMGKGKDPIRAPKKKKQVKKNNAFHYA